MEQETNTSYQEIISTNKKAFKCLFFGCEKIFRYESDIKRHVIVHSIAKSFACQFLNCTKSFKRQDALKHHMKIHSEVFLLTCPVPGCNSQFQKKTALTYHLKKHKNEKFFCDFPGCQRSFSTLKSLRQHQNTKQYHEKLTKFLQKSNKKDLNDFDPFENWDPKLNFDVLQPIILDEDLSEKSVKFLHTEKGRGDCFRFENLQERYCEFDLLKNDLRMLVICNYFLEENKKIKEKLAVREHENHLDSTFKKALSFQFDDMNNEQSLKLDP